MSDHGDGEAAVQPQLATPRSSLGSGAGLSYSSGSSISPSTSTNSSNSAKVAVSECLGAWLNYLNSLNTLCASGYRLSQTICNLEQHTEQGATASAGITAIQLNSAWNDLAQASSVATSTVKSHIVAVLQDYVTQPLTTVQEQADAGVKDYNQGIVNEISQTMINLQNQFCVASYDSFVPFATGCLANQGVHEQDPFLSSSMPPNVTKHPSESSSRSRTTSPHFPQHRQLFGSTHSDPTTATLDHQTRGPSPHQDIRGPSPIQGFLDNVRGPLPNPGHLLAMKTPFYRGSRSPLNFPLFPLTGQQRRWSEAAAGEANSESALDVESQMRRWSMPWEATKTDRNWQQQNRNIPISKLAVPHQHATTTTASNRSQCTTPDSVWQSSITSQDGLAEAIQLLSFKPANRYNTMMHHSVMPPSPLQGHMGNINTASPLPPHSVAHPPFIEESHPSGVSRFDSIGS